MASTMTANTLLINLVTTSSLTVSSILNNYLFSRVGSISSLIVSSLVASDITFNSVTFSSFEVSTLNSLTLQFVNGSVSSFSASTLTTGYCESQLASISTAHISSLNVSYIATNDLYGKFGVMSTLIASTVNGVTIDTYNTQALFVDPIRNDNLYAQGYLTYNSTTKEIVYNSEGLPGYTGATGSTGATGVAGTQILSGNGVPAAGLGNPGDFYIDLLTGKMYGPKSV
jgi:hypothetical protein